MNVQLQHRLENRLALRIGLLLGLFVLALGLLIFGYGYYRHMQDARERQDQLARTVLNSAAVAAFARNPEIARDVISGLEGNSYVRAAKIVSSDGVSLLPQSDQAIDWSSGQSSAYRLYSPVSQDEVIGTLVIAPNVQRISIDAMVYGFGYTALPVLEILAATVLIIFLIRKHVGRPVAKIAIGLSGINPGDRQGVRLAVPTGHEDDEIGLLAVSANRLIEATEGALMQERSLRLKVQDMEARYRRIFQSTNIGIMVLSIDGQLVNCNPALLDKIVAMPMTQEELAGVPDVIGHIFQVPQTAWALVQQSMDEQHAVTADLQLHTHDADPPRWVHAIFSVSRTPDGQPDCIEAVLYDVTQRKLKEDEVRRAAERDPLTTLHNRRGFELYLDKSLRRAQEDGVACCVMLIDLDGFKSVNDLHGHAAGDQVLKVVAQRLHKLVRRSTDFVGRLGGDEFVIVRYDCGRAHGPLEQLAASVVTQMCEPIDLGAGAVTRVGASIGLAMFPEDGFTKHQLLQEADEAMYAVKRRGKNGFAWAAPPDSQD